MYEVLERYDSILKAGEIITCSKRLFALGKLVSSTAQVTSRSGDDTDIVSGSVTAGTSQDFGSPLLTQAEQGIL